MTEPPPPRPTSEADAIPSVAARLVLWERAGGVVTPTLTSAWTFLSSTAVSACERAAPVGRPRKRPVSSNSSSGVACSGKAKL